MNAGHPLEVVLARLEPAFRDLAADPSARAAGDAGAFARAPAVEGWLRELRGADAPDPAAEGEWLTLCFACFRFWRDGRLVLAPAADALEIRLAHPDPPADPLPDTACYVRFPERRVWARTRAGGPHEPVDGLLVVPRAAPRAVTIVAVIGAHPAREGFTQVSATATAADLAAAFTALPAAPFAPAMAGGAEAGFRSLTTTAELLAAAQLAIAAAAT